MTGKNPRAASSVVDHATTGRTQSAPTLTGAAPGTYTTPESGRVVGHIPRAKESANALSPGKIAGRFDGETEW